MVGLMGALELVKSKEPLERFDAKQGVGGIARDLFIENGLCLRASGDTIICAPPFTLSHSEADTIIEVTRKVLDLTARAIKA
jgi:putrescine aminotransferase